MRLSREQAVAIASRLGLNSDRLEIKSVSGGDTSPTFRLVCGEVAVFVKTADGGQADMLDCEADGLQALAETGCLRVPAILGQGLVEDSNRAWLALEALNLRPRNAAADRVLGQQLAAVHNCTGERYGWSRDNFLGRNRQANRPAADWSDFFCNQRLRPQIEQLQSSHPGMISSVLTDRALQRWSALCRHHHQPPPSLLHGDLWSGNASCLADDCPVVYDPAVHYGDAECDLAMAELFGGFSDDFFLAYAKARPLSPGWRQRRVFYQLYHLLNHANLFGGGYLNRVRAELERVIC